MYKEGFSILLSKVKGYNEIGLTITSKMPLNAKPQHKMHFFHRKKIILNKKYYVFTPRYIMQSKYFS